ncbi:MAG: tetratricopeptide repeat protein [Methanoregula sp.]|nr:tetratricopeptide repeat protein [Methanoregula sp.]
MKTGQFLNILAILLLIAGFVPLVAAAENETPDAGTTYYNAGIQLLNSNEYQRAIDLFDQALASNTTMISQSDALLYLYQGKSYALIQLEKYDEAIQTLDEGLAVYPKDSMLWNNKGYSQFKSGNYQEALKSYDMAISIDQNYTTSLVNKGDTLFKMGRFNDAVDAYSKANVTDPGNKLAMDGMEKAKQAAASEIPLTTIALVVILIIVAGGAVYYLKFRKPAEEKPAEKKTKGKKK